MNITLRNTKVNSLELKQAEGAIADDTMQFSYSVGYNDELKRSFIVGFDTLLTSKDEGFSLSIDYVAYFETDGDIDENFKNSHFPEVNAPAIAYPFLRSFISTLSVNAGYQAILVPTINFQALAKKKKEELDSLVLTKLNIEDSDS